MKKFSMTDVKNQNRLDVFRCLYKQGSCSRRSIADTLNMSLPTVSQHLNSLIEAGLIHTPGYFNSGLGRKAVAYAVNGNACIALGVEITAARLTYVAINLFGEIIAKRHTEISFAMNEKYYQTLAQGVKQFISNYHLEDQQILGVGLAIQGLVSLDGTEVTYGEILQCTGLKIDAFSSRIPYPCRFFHDSHCAAICELWENKAIKNAVFLLLSYHLGSVIMINGSTFTGRGGRSGTLEHVQLSAEGRTCYCGQKDCADCYCSLHALLDKRETLEEYLQKKAAGDEEACSRWEAFLNHLSLLIHNAQMMLDGDVILGGYLAACLSDEDLRHIHEMVRLRTSIPQADSEIIISKNPDNAICRGAAIPYIRDFLKHIDVL